MIASVASKIDFYQRDNASSIKELKENLKVLTESKEIEKSQPKPFICITSEYTATKSKNNNQSGDIRRDVNTVERNPVLCCVCGVEGTINQLFFFLNGIINFFPFLIPSQMYRRGKRSWLHGVYPKKKSNVA